MRVFVLGCLLCMGLWAKSYIISPLPLPKQEIIDFEVRSCDKRCLNKLYEEGLYFSFIGRFQDEQDSDLNLLWRCKNYLFLIYLVPQMVISQR